MVKQFWVFGQYIYIYYIYIYTHTYTQIYIHTYMVCVLSCVWFFATPWTVGHQAPLSMEFSRQEYWGGLPFSSSRESSWPRDETLLTCIGRDSLALGPWEAKRALRVHTHTNTHTIKLVNQSIAPFFFLLCLKDFTTKNLSALRVNSIKIFPLKRVWEFWAGITTTPNYIRYLIW